MNKRQKLFVRCYTSRADAKCFGNATQSAIKAGYSERTGYVHGCKLLKLAKIKEAISVIEQAEQEQFNITKEDAMLEARSNYLEALTDTMKKYWNDIYLKLKGWDVQKIDIKDTTDRTGTEKKELTEINNRVFDVTSLVSSN